MKMPTRMKNSLFRSIAFIAVISIIGVFLAPFIVDRYSNLSPVGVRYLYTEIVASNELGYSDSHIHFADIAVNKKDKQDQSGKTKPESHNIDSHQTVTTIKSITVQKLQSLQLGGVNNPGSPRTERGFKHSLKLAEHYNVSTENLQVRSPVKDLKHKSQQLVDHDTRYSNLHSYSIQQANAVPKTSLLKSTVLTDRSESSAKGHVLAINYYEQQSMGSRNLFQLQCWAQHLGLVVVKPVMKDSSLITPLDQHQQQSLLKFEDSFDLGEWTKQTITSHFAPLVEWSEFLSKAPRDVILVLYNYPSVSVLKSRQKAGEPVLQDHVGDRYQSGCGSNWPTSSQLAFLKANNFRVVRSVCFNFYYGDQLTMDEFNAHLLGEHPARNVTIIMDLWRGLGTGQRVLIKDVCTSAYPLNEYIKLSSQLHDDAVKYIETYLRGFPYIAVMGRLEMTLITVHKKEPVLPFCLKKIVSELDEFKKDMKINTVFLSIDIGRYGSKKWRTSIDPDLKRDFSSFVQNIYGPSMSVGRWEKTFEDTAMTRDAGYIGLLQKAIVTQAKCILFVGGGAFQRHALHLYKQLHPRKEDRCIRVVSSCTSSTKFQL